MEVWGVPLRTVGHPVQDAWRCGGPLFTVRIAFSVCQTSSLEGAWWELVGFWDSSVFVNSIH